jgi:small subunit ribosomal protein S35
MGEQHPAEKKVAVEFCTLDMRDLTPVQRAKLRKLAGVRYNPETDIVKMSCEMFPSQAQNKRYLGDKINEMLREAKVCVLTRLRCHLFNIYRIRRTHLKTSLST